MLRPSPHAGLQIEKEFQYWLVDFGNPEATEQATQLRVFWAKPANFLVSQGNSTLAGSSYFAKHLALVVPGAH
jgi:hypothetical protein